ncbi:pyridoxamine 5'-phosphate oxidase [Roseibacillus ishigakijimensis]|uniref:Pyridoxamine 5'-phosphate oxidase n=1 Tax=Roseibacillus ishigakijimensis TaxID=454146 RepID=A0A934VMC9_9BACT|nr:pyridoxamine 5'-phosphate oxidase [Roseibacillus ishigakijimensis]MBK1835624.1 pyridoxamine 5'-phosphate oxidase [Roseibacillus ishigakijimensis]
MNRDEIDIAALRQNYTRGGLDCEDMAGDPLAQFEKWLQEAIAAGLLEPNAMSLATVSAEGLPSLRTVLLKGLDERGFRFFTNYRSQKGRDLLDNENAALSFLWKELERQVNIQGRVSKISREESAEYFHSRPYESQIGAWVSEVQSGEINSRCYLEEREDLMRMRYPEGSEVPLPEFWGGYVLEPVTVEFWQGRESRLHDRLRYQKAPNGRWDIVRLSS